MRSLINTLITIPCILALYACKGQETNPGIVYPDNCYSHNHQRGQVIDITRAPYNADPSGIEDCTDALIAAYDYVVDLLREDRYNIPGTTTVIYLPNGTYKVSNTIIYSGEPFMRPNGHENIRTIRFRGQSREGTMIRLADHSAGFGENAYKPVVSFGKHSRNNAVSSNFFEDITINTGKGNPGAVGLRFHGANNEAVRNVHIYSEDGAGKTGLDMPMGACQGVYKHILIEGFNYGIHASEHLAKSLTFEFVTLRNQKKYGIYLEESSISMRRITSQNAVPALKLASLEGLAVVLDSEFSGGSGEVPAIEIDKGVLFARNVRTSGYGTAVQKGGAEWVRGPGIEEYVSEEKIFLFEQPSDRSLNLPVEETPEYPWETDLGKWICVNDYGATGDGETDDTRAIQKALNAGFPVVYFLPGNYRINGTINIPSGVEYINFMFSQITAGKDIAPVPDMPMFRISENTDVPLFFEDLLSWSHSDGVYCMIEHATSRTLVLKDFHAQRGRTYCNTVEGGKVFFENASVRTHSSGSRDHLAYHFRGQQVLIRYFDPEYFIPEILVDNSTVWILGFKTESHATSFEVINGGRLEILGGVVNSWGMRAHHPQLPVIINKESSVTGVFVTGGPESGEGVYFQHLIEETQRGETRDFMWRDAYHRFGDQRIVPLYLGYQQ